MKVLKPDCCRFELKLNSRQKEQCIKFGEACRFVWNKLLEKNIERYKKEGKRLSEFDMNKLITTLKKNWRWLKKAPSQALQQVSNNLNKAYENFFRHMKNKRKDELHKITTYLANNHGIVVLEALKTKNMMKSAKGTVENPGKNVKAKSGLNRSIADEAWHLLQRLLEYKMERRGGKVIYVDPKYTSQQCSQCKHVSKNNRKSQAYFVCERCRYNILNRYLEAAGHAVTACGRRTKVLSLNQELVNRNPATTSQSRAPV